MILRMSLSLISSKVASSWIPALLTRMSILPHASRAVWTTALALSRSATLLVSAIASPPLAQISSATVSAFARRLPRPSGPTPNR